MGSTGVPDSTVGVTTDVGTTAAGFTDGLASLNADAGLKGARDLSTAASEMAIAGLKDTRDSSTVVFEVAIAAFTAARTSVAAPANSTAVTMAAGEATAGGTGKFPGISIPEEHWRGGSTASRFGFLCPG